MHLNQEQTSGKNATTIKQNSLILIPIQHINFGFSYEV